jgi:hypothetical protein
MRRPWLPRDGGNLPMKQKRTAFTIKPFKNRNGVISFRVAGWLLGERVRNNFTTREDAAAERAALEGQARARIVPAN